MDFTTPKGAVLKRGLGRGIGALLPDVVSPEKGQLLQCQIKHIAADTNQPRRRFVDENLAELAQSIKEHGVIQPLLVKPAATAGHFTVIAGERRLRAAAQAGLSEVPVIVMDLDEAQGLQVSLIENLQREDLNPLEEALGYARLVNEFSLTHQDIAKLLGKNRTTITNMLRLLKLAPEAQQALAAGELSMGHGRALLALTDENLQEYALHETLTHKLSVREFEKLIRKLKKEGLPVVADNQLTLVEKSDSSEFAGADKLISEKLEKVFSFGARVHRLSGGRGRIELNFNSAEELRDLLEILGCE
jgi:ParB family chromosome partitioning protein